MKRNIKALIQAIITAFAILIKLDVHTVIDSTSTDVITLTYFILGIFLFFFYRNCKVKKYKALNLLSILFALFMIFGYSYELVGTSKLVLGNFLFILISVFKFLGFYFLFTTALSFLYEKLIFLSKYKLKTEKCTKIISLVESHPFLFSFIAILICWLPYMIAFYPAILSPDPSNQIKMFFGFPTHYITGVNLIDESVVITNHHPFLHTLLLGGLAKLGYNLGSINFGLFLYSLLQIVILSSTLAYTIKYMTKIKTNKIVIFLSLIIYCFVPCFPMYAMSSVKDVFFGAFIVLYCIQIFDLVTFNTYTYKQYLLLFINMLFLCLFRNNGIYTICLSFPFLFIILKRNWKPILIVFLAVFLTYEGYNKMLLPSLKITEGSIREMLSIPFQQTARYVKYYPNEVTAKEKKAIDKILDYDTLADRYKENISDPVKNKFNKDASSEDLKKYFYVWFKMFFKHPDTYLNATVNTVYGYFYPNTTNWYIYYKQDNRLSEVGLDYHYNHLSGLRNVLSGYGLSYPYIPIIGMLCNIGFMVWCYLFMTSVLLIQKNYKYLVVMAIPLSLVLVCVAGPVNTYFRYTLPYVFAFPTFFAFLLKIIKDSN